jgi:hypothetical protein
VKIKRILRQSKAFRERLQADGGGRPPNLNRVADLLLEQARTLYRHWPDSFTTELV